MDLYIDSEIYMGNVERLVDVYRTGSKRTRTLIESNVPAIAKTNGLNVFQGMTFKELVEEYDKRHYNKVSLKDAVGRGSLYWVKLKLPTATKAELYDGLDVAIRTNDARLFEFIYPVWEDKAGKNAWSKVILKDNAKTFYAKEIYEYLTSGERKPDEMEWLDDNEDWSLEYAGDEEWI